MFLPKVGFIRMIKFPDASSLGRMKAKSRAVSSGAALAGFDWNYFAAVCVPLNSMRTIWVSLLLPQAVPHSMR